MAPVALKYNEGDHGCHYYQYLLPYPDQDLRCFNTPARKTRSVR